MESLLRKYGCYVAICRDEGQVKFHRATRTKRKKKCLGSLVFADQHLLNPYSACTREGPITKFSAQMSAKRLQAQEFEYTGSQTEQA